MPNPTSITLHEKQEAHVNNSSMRFALPMVSGRHHLGNRPLPYDISGYLSIYHAFIQHAVNELQHIGAVIALAFRCDGQYLENSYQSLRSVPSCLFHHQMMPIVNSHLINRRTRTSARSVSSFTTMPRLQVRINFVSPQPSAWMKPNNSQDPGNQLQRCIRHISKLAHHVTNKNRLMSHLTLEIQILIIHQ